MQPNHLQDDGEWTLVQRGRRRRTPRDPHYPPTLMDFSAWAAPAPEARFHHFDHGHERLWAPRHPSPRRWEQHARPVRDWSPYGATRHHHEGWSEAHGPAYSPPRRPAYTPPRRPAYSPPRREAQEPLHRRAPETRRAPRHPARAPSPPAGPRRVRPQVRPPPPRPDPRPRDRPRPPVTTAARTGSARPPPPRQAPRAPAAQLSDDPDSWRP